MNYVEDHAFLSSIINYTDELITADDSIDIMNFSFRSEHFDMLPGETMYHCTEHTFTSNGCYRFNPAAGSTRDVLDINDSHIAENRQFRYHLFLPKGATKTTHFILLLHGFNEKTWNKYYTWAKRMVLQTGKAVLLFPIALHMNRAPGAWSDKRKMFDASEQRKIEYPYLLHSSLSNVAISTRLHAKPERFVWSGLQTYYDIIQLVQQVKAGMHPVIDAAAGIDIFAYSIGAFLAEILMMANHRDYFSHSKLAIFCGGPVFNRIAPVSKFILDSEAEVKLYSFLVEHLDSYIEKDDRLHHYLGASHTEGICFRSMLNYNAFSSFREKSFRQLAPRLYALALEGDTVIYPYEVLNSLQGQYRNIPVKVDSIQLPYPFIHELPFPSTLKTAEQVTTQFNVIFDRICRHLR